MNIALRKILCPVDFSKTSEQALRYAVALAENFDAELVLLHVDELPALAIGDYYGLSSAEFELAAPQLPPAAAAALGSKANDDQDALEAMAGQLQEGHKCRIRTCRRRGMAFLEIIYSAREEAVDLIVMGTHGRTGLSHVLMGSTAEKVVRTAPCPVLTVKHPEHEFVMP